MKRSQEKERQFKGEITVFLTLIFVLMLSIIGALVESASIYMTKTRKRTDTELALESVFAEYDKRMLEEYDLFVRYGCSESMLKGRLEYYGAINISHEIQRRELLTDNGGKPFREQAIRYAKDWIGLKGDSFQTEREDIIGKTPDLEETIQLELTDLPEENNPLFNVSRLRETGILSLVTEQPEQLSDRIITIEELPSARELQAGNWGSRETEGSTDKAFFMAYLAEHFGDYLGQKKERALLYEQEYLLEGYAEDKRNLEKVCEKLLKTRMAINSAYLLTDSVKQAEAEAMALTLCSLLTVPGITQVVKHALLLAWSYGESIVDVRLLLQGKNVSAVKTAETWQLQLVNLVKLGTDEEVVNEKDTKVGLSYQTYLKGFLLLENKETLSMRSLDLIEANLQIKTDECMTKAEMKSRVTLRRGVKDMFLTSFGYQ